MWASPSLAPVRQNRRRIDRLDLLAEAFAIEGQQCVMGAVGGAAHRIDRQDDAIAMVDRPKHGGEDAYVGFRAGDHQAIGLANAEQLRQRGRGEGRIGGLVDYRGRRHQRRQGRDELDPAGIDALAGKLPPTLKVAPPAARRVFRARGRYEAGEDGAMRLALGDLSYPRKYLGQPGDSPWRVEGEHVLHIDAEMDCAVGERTKGKRSPRHGEAGTFANAALFRMAESPARAAEIIFSRRHAGCRLRPREDERQGDKGAITR